MATTPEDINRQVRELARFDEVHTPLYRLMRAGGLVTELANGLRMAQQLLETMEPVEAPEDWGILVLPKGDETPLRIQRVAAGREGYETKYLRAEPLEEEVERVLGVRKGPNDHFAFAGQTIEYDISEGKFFVYDADRATRVEHNESFSLVSMIPLEEVQRRYPVSLGYPEVREPVVHTPF